MTKIEVSQVSKSFSKNTDVLSNISFTINDGEFLSILGPSGCGKTTLLRILIGLENPDQGRLYKDGIEITHKSPGKRGIGVVFQNYALFENMTALENVAYALKKNKSTKRSAYDIARKMLNSVGLLEHENKKPCQLSGGQQQRVAIARTLALNPDVILFDEPMSALDVETRLSLRSELKSIQRQFGTTMIYVTHDQEEAFAMSDRIMVMDKGVIHQIDTPHNIVDHPADDYVRSFVLRNIQIKVNSLVKYAREEDCE